MEFNLLFFRGAFQETNNYLREPFRILVNDAVAGIFKCHQPRVWKLLRKHVGILRRCENIFGTRHEKGGALDLRKAVPTSLPCVHGCRLMFSGEELAMGRENTSFT